MPEFNLLESAGLSQLKERKGIRIVTPEIRAISKKLGFEYYDGDRKFGFGGYYYDGRWREVAKMAKKRYNLNNNSKILIERDEKGFLTHDLKNLIPNAIVYGMHPSEYSINHAMEGYGKWKVNKLENKKFLNNVDLENLIEKKAKEKVIPFLIKGDNLEIPFRDNYFDTVISINSICNHKEKGCRKVLREIIRISKDGGKRCYIQNDSWKTQEQKNKLMDWVLICETFLRVDEWEKLFEEEGYKGDWGFVMFK